MIFSSGLTGKRCSLTASQAILVLLIFCSLNSFGQEDNFMSKIYFPGGIGLSIPSDGPRDNVSNGFLLNTALEYRPATGNSVFFRFNYDAVNNHYRQVIQNSPTNVTTGKLSSTYYLLGAGFRKKVKLVGYYGVIQPGIGLNSYDLVKTDASAYSIEQLTKRHLSIKFTAGMEYYLAAHFALTFEPSYFYISPRAGYKLLNPQSINLSVGFTTTLF